MSGHVAVIGDGAMGTMSALLVAENGRAVRLWGRDAQRTDDINRDRENQCYLPGISLPDSVTAGCDAAWALVGAEFVISAVPCQHVRGVWTTVGPALPPGVPVLSVAKGIEVDTLLRPTQVLAELCGQRSYAILSGPNIAAEIARGLPAGAVVAGEDHSFCEQVQVAMHTETFRIYTNPDIIGVELAAALKNVIALAAGVVDGLKLGDNAKAALITRGLAEITRLGVAMGASPETFYGMAGVGDLITTCMSPHSRNRTAGQKIGEGLSPDEVRNATPSVIEGIPTTRSTIALAHKYNVDVPITTAVGAVLFDGVPPEDAVRELMTRKLKSEQ
jgi:glycerol-3-phosphate dehydrogenase (NAD(P)+)